jgi:hypothetical protein
MQKIEIFFLVTKRSDYTVHQFEDFMKAFDTVPHRRLLSKLEAHGVQEKVLKWVGAFLEERVQRVVVNGASSEQAKVCYQHP